MVNDPVVEVMVRPLTVLLVKASAPARVAKVPEVGKVKAVLPVVDRSRLWFESPKVIVPVLPAPKVRLLAIESWVPAPVSVLEAVVTARVRPLPILSVLLPLLVTLRPLTCR